MRGLVLERAPELVGEAEVEPEGLRLGALRRLREALAGERAFNGASWRAITEQIMRGEPVPLHERRRDIPIELSQFLARSLSANPRARPATAKEMQDELRAIFEDARKASVSIYAPPPSIMQAPPPKERPSASRIAVEPYTDETETRRSPRTGRAGGPTSSAPARVSPPPAPPPAPPAQIPPIEEPHPAASDEMDRTLERIDAPGRKAAIGALAGEEDETQTTKMSPELRARIDQLMGAPPAAKSDKKSR